jgi:hypothetical protein
MEIRAPTLTLGNLKVIASEDRVVLLEATDQDMRPIDACALLSRSQLGEDALGVNRARIERWRSS